MPKKQKVKLEPLEEVSFHCPICKMEGLPLELKKHIPECALKREAMEEDKKRYNELRHKPRIQANDLDEFCRLAEKSIKEYYDLDVTVGVKVKTFTTQLSSSSHSPIGQKCQGYYVEGKERIYYCGWKADVSVYVDPAKWKKFVKTKKYNKQICRHDLQVFIQEFIAGVHTGTGGGGECSVGYDCEIFLDDFPRIKEKYARYNDVKKLHDEFCKKANSRSAASRLEADTDPAVVSLRKERDEIKQKVYAIERKIDEAFKAKVEDHIKKNPIVQPYRQEEWDHLYNTFKPANGWY